MSDIIDFLKNEGVSEGILKDVTDFRLSHKVNPGLEKRIPVPRYNYYGAEIWEEALSAILSGENLLLVGPKATGKNVLAEGLSQAFGRPQWDVSLYGNSDAAALTGTATF